MNVLITGGTGTFGQAYAKQLLARDGFPPNKVIIFSRDEQKQEDMERTIEDPHNRLRFVCGDVRDVDRLRFAMRGVTRVVHAAAMKIVPKCEYDPIEAVRTNIGGAENVVRAAADAGVGQVVALSTDKAVSPVNLYGATKMAMEKMFIAANNLTGVNGTQFSLVRYGNVAGSRGSVIPFFRKLLAEGRDTLPVTHPDMSRYWMTKAQAVDLVDLAFDRMIGGEIFIPRMPSFMVTDLVKAMGADFEIVGLRPGEKINESIIGELEPYTITDAGGAYALTSLERHENEPATGISLPMESHRNKDWLSVSQLAKEIENV